MLIPYAYGGITLQIRSELATAEQMIVREVQTAYAWDFPIGRAIDVGGHIGAWTIYAKYRQPDTKIAVIEVDSANMELLRLNTQGLSGVQVFAAQCGYTSGSYEVARHAYNSGTTRVIAAHERPTYTEHPHIWSLHPAPPRKTLEAIMQACRWDAFETLKLDCEGGETDIITHIAEPTLDAIQHIVGEIHTYPAEFEQQTQHRLARNGFHISYTPHPANPQLHTFHAWR